MCVPTYILVGRPIVLSKLSMTYVSLISELQLHHFISRFSIIDAFVKIIKLKYNFVRMTRFWNTKITIIDG